MLSLFGCAGQRHRWLLIAACLSMSSAVSSLVAVGSAGAMVPPFAVVPLTVQGGQGTPRGADPVVNVRVGGSNPVPVYLDTGSSGLRIFANKVPTGQGSGVTVTSQPSNITYEGGYSFTGVVAVGSGYGRDAGDGRARVVCPRERGVVQGDEALVSGGGRNIRLRIVQGRGRGPRDRHAKQPR